MNEQSPDPQSPDVSLLIKSADPETQAQVRRRVIATVVGASQALAQQFSRVDHPLAREDQLDDYELAVEEFKALVAQVVHLPESVEGVRHLEQWNATRLAQVNELMQGARTGTTLQIGQDRTPYVMTEDFAKGVRAALHVVKDMYGKFPVSISCD
jgi:hypothetical protein